MKQKRAGANRSQALRKRAEERLRKGSKRKPHSNWDLRRLVHELEIHQIELKLQNEELRNAQVELAASRDRYTDLYEFAPLAYITLDKDGRIRESNLMAGRIFGVERQSLLRTTLTKFITNESQDDWYLHRQAALSSDTKQVCELGMRRADGTSLSVRAETTASGYGSQRLCRTVLLDITERKQAEEKSEQLLSREQAARREVEAATKAKDRFLATVSHELRTPLTPILGWSRLLRGKTLNNAKADSALESIERNARMQQRLIDDLLDISGNIAGKLRLKCQPVKLPGIIHAAIDTLQLDADAKAMQIITQLDEDGSVVNGDPARLQQVICNLLSNAVKFTPQGGQIKVNLERVGSNIQISVSDTGRGIPENFLPFIFDHFSQADNSSMRRHGGLGLGLAIVRLIVDKHGGKVEVRSKEGRGTTFTVSIPITNVFGDASGAEGAAPVVHPVTKEPHTYMSGFEGRRILVVDDEADTLEMLKTVLSGTHAEVRACSNVIEALEVLKGWTPDALISDLDMPYEDGYALITKVRELELRSGNHVVSIALTAHVQVEDRERAFSFGFDAFVAKPVAPNELLATVCSHLLDAA